MTREVWALLGMCGCGIVCSALFDAFRSIHRVMRHDAAVIISDIIYWALVCAAVIYSLWLLNGGELRGYEFVGLFTGALLYFLTVSAYVYSFFLTICGFCVKIIARIYKILLTLRGFLYKITIAPIRGAVKQFSWKRKNNGG